VLEPGERDRALLRLLAKYHGGEKKRENRVIVFVLYKKEADRVAGFLAREGWVNGVIHGDLSQDARTRAFLAFKAGTVPVLVATDVAARGLDIPNVEVVINYSFPLTIEDYVHRIGRTGRAGKTGLAHTFFTHLDKAHSGELVNVLREAGAPIPEALTKFGCTVKRKEHALYGAHFKAGGDGPPLAEKGAKMTFDD
jgi:ATP-dependent RNA helicase DBP3